MPLAEDSGINTNQYPDGAIASSGGPIATANTVLFTVNTIGYETLVVQLSGAYNGSLVVKQSLDNINYDDRIYDERDSNILTGTGIYQIPVVGLYIQLSTTGSFSADTVKGVSWIALFRNSSLYSPDNKIDSTIIKGQDNNGINHEITTDINGNIVISDATRPIFGSASGLNQILFSVDTTGYNSISVQLIGTFSGTVAFQTSNNNVDWSSAPGVLVSGTSVVVSIVTSANILVFQVSGKYFRAIFTIYTSGVCNSIAYLRSQNVSPLLNVPNANILQVANTNVPGSGTSGVLPVAGNTLPGSAQVSYPLPIGAVDDNLLARRVVSDAYGDLRIVGPRYIDQGQQPIVVRNQSTDASGLSVTESLQEIVYQLKYLSKLIKDLPEMLNSAGQSYPDDDDPSLTDYQSFRRS